jgi:hypothetical protein
MRRGLASSVFLIFLLIPATVRARSVVPQFVLGGGFDFLILIANKAQTEEELSFTLLEGFDQPWTAPFSVNGQPHNGNTILVRLGPHAVKKLHLTGGDDLHVGYLSFTEDIGFGNFVTPMATQLFYEYRQDGELIDSIGAPRGLATFGSNALAFPVERSGQTNTGFALAPWAPPGSEVVFQYTLRLFDEDGNQVGRETLHFSGHMARFFDEIFPKIPATFLGWLSVEVSGSTFGMEHVYVTVIRQELTSSGFQLTNIEPDFGVLSQLP